MVKTTKNHTANVDRKEIAGESALAGIVQILALIGIPILVTALYAKLNYAGLMNSDAIDFAQIGRNLSEGRGFTTYVLRPLTMAHAVDPTRVPDVTHGPLYPFIMALAFGVSGARDSIVAGVSAVFHLATVGLIYILGMRLFGKTVGLCAALAFACNPLSLEYAISGLDITLYTFLMTALMLSLHVIAAQSGLAFHTAAPSAQRSPSKKGIAPRVLAGVLTGLLYLADPIFIWAAPVVIGCVLTMSPARKWGASISVILAFAAVALPWMVRNAALTGNPVFGARGLELWMSTPSYPEYGGYRLDPQSMLPTPSLVREIAAKWAVNLGVVVQTLPQEPASWLLAFFLPGLLVRFLDTSAAHVRSAVIFVSIALLAGSIALRVDMPLLSSTVPVMLVFSIGYVARLAANSNRPVQTARMASGLLAATLVVPLAGRLGLDPRPNPLVEAGTARNLAKLTPADDAVLSDQPWLVAWYADRPSILIPSDDKRIGEYRSRYPNLRWMFLTSGVAEYSAAWKYLHDYLQNWNTLAEREMPMKTLTPVTITGGREPLFQSLKGFSTVTPLAGQPAAAVVAQSSPATREPALVRASTPAASTGNTAR